MPEDLDTAAALQEEIGEEYKKLEIHVRNHIDPDETTEIAKSELNSRRNRYQDMVPYDSNLVTLSKETGTLKNIQHFIIAISLGNPKSKYINASWVNFKSTA